MTPSTCAIQCRATAGCQYFIMKKPTVAGGTSTCYLKMKALGGLYGTTGRADVQRCRLPGRHISRLFMFARREIHGSR